MVFKQILDSLTLPKKCAIIALPLLLAFGFLFQQMYAQINTLINSSKNELQGAVFLEKVNPVLQKVLADRAQEKSAAVADASSALTGLKADVPANWSNTANNIDSLAQTLPQALGSPVDSPQSKQLGNQIVTLVRQLADDSELTLDPFLPTYYMMSPIAFQLPGVMEDL